LELVGRVWTRLVDSGWQPTLSEAQKQELDRRLAALEANPREVVSWDSIVDHVRRPR
jgi:putative addiction module component (TIGR02574 family)